MSEKKEEHCIFCIEIDKPGGLENLMIYRGKLAFVILNLFPYTNGHLMVVPFEHRASLEELDPEIRCEMMELTTRSLVVLREEYHPEGFNVGINIGEASGAGIAEHVHIHVVPRWVGDTNFMTALASTRVLPEALEDTLRRIKRAWKDKED